MTEQKTPWLDRIRRFDVLDSTNSHAKELAQQGAPEGTAVIAARQTGGRGRMGRSFSSPEGGLYYSLILRPQCPASRLQHLTCAVALAAADAVEQVSGIAPDIKWVNDLMIGGKKVGGILTELSLNGDGTVRYAVIGAGINCGKVPEDVADIATSLERETGKAVSPDKMAAALTEQLYRMTGELFSDGIMDRYAARCITLGKQVTVLRENGGEQGFACAVGRDGGLTVRFPDGREEILHSGEVSVKYL